MAIFKYIKVGGGSFRLRSGKKVKQNEEFIADENEIPQSMADLCKKLSTVGPHIESKKEEPKAPAKPAAKTQTKAKDKTESKAKVKAADKKEGPKFILQPVDDESGLYNIVNSETEKVVNPEPIEEEEAIEAVKALNADN